MARKPTKVEKELALERYEESKKKGKSFYPYVLYKDAIVGLLVVAAIAILAFLVPAKLEAMADPTSTTYNPRPEWYFLFFFEFLKLFPGSLEAVAAIVIPALAIIFLIALPFIDSRLERSWSARKPALAGGILAVLIFATLVVAGALSSPARPAGEENLLVQEGRDVYQQINCSYCHSINGVGGNIGPDLGSVGQNLTQEQIMAYLQNPHAMVPQTLHPKLLFTNEELNALVSYLETLGAPVAYSADAPNLYTQNCGACHTLNGSGGRLGPDLTNIGDRRPLSFLEAFISEPASVLPDSTMPSFKDKLSDPQIKDIAAYLFSQKASATPTPTASPTTTPTLTPTPPASSPPATSPPATSPTAETPPLIPHDLQGRDNCLACHETGVAGAPIVPASHAGRTNDMCRLCHQPGPEND